MNARHARFEGYAGGRDRDSGDFCRYCIDLDGLSDGRRLGCLAIVDDFSRECLTPEVDTSLTGRRVAAVPDRLTDTRGSPESIIEVFYNPIRRHSHLGGVSPAAIEGASQRGSGAS